MVSCLTRGASEVPIEEAVKISCDVVTALGVHRKRCLDGLSVREGKKYLYTFEEASRELLSDVSL